MEPGIRYSKIVFIDEEDTALAPFAAKLLEKKLMDMQIYDVEVLSRGTVVLFDEPANPKIAELAWGFGVNLSFHRAEALEESIFDEAGLYLCMDAQSKLKAFAKCRIAADIFTLREYLLEQGDVYFPRGGTLGQYEAACQNVGKLIDLLIEKIIPGNKNGIEDYGLEEEK